MAKAASALCGDPDLGRRVGEEMYFLSAAEGTTDFLRATGSVGAACDALAGHGSRMSSDRPIWVHARADSWVEPRTRVPSAEIGDRFFCGTTAGYFARLPSLFGHVGAVIEQECRTSPRADRSLEEDAVWSPRGESNS